MEERKITKDSDLADHRFMVLYKHASDDAQAREILAVIRDLLRNATYDDFYHKSEVNKLFAVLERWGITDINVDVLKDLIRRAREPRKPGKEVKNAKRVRKERRRYKPRTRSRRNNTKAAPKRRKT